MESKPVKQKVTLALDTLAMRGRFTVRDVAEKAYAEGVRFDGLSLADQKSVTIEFLMREAKNQMKAPLRQELQEEQIKKLPPKFWPIVSKLTKTICVMQGHSAYHVYTVYATADDWDAYLSMAETMERRAKSAKNSGRNIRDLLRTEGADTLFELMTGTRARRLAVGGN